MQQIVDQLKKHEGLRLKPYRCTENKLTIGYGRNIDDSGISSVEAELLLRNDVQRVHMQLISHYPNFTSHDQVRQAVLINMAFNLGINGLMQFTKMQAALKKKDYAMAANEMLRSRWAKQVGCRSNELAVQMQTGCWA